ncbi:MAG: CHASE2 domain-containing protein [Candidatus Omnitrophica bacterium]|nr:CHASE2 domain-containing protein [Candidatus Omnitrophota bacterium]
MPKPKISRKALRYSIVVIILTSVIMASYFRVFETFELSTLDLRFRTRPRQSVISDIAIIEIAQDTIDKIGQWPIDRKFHAALVDTLTACGVKAVIFDILFSTKSNQLSDAQLVESVSSAGNVYLPVAMRLSENITSGVFPDAVSVESGPMPELAEKARGIGHINVITDIDGKRRRVPLFISYGKELIPQISLLAVCDALSIDIKSIKVENGKLLVPGPGLEIPVDSRGQIMINYAGRWGEVFSHYSFIDILTSYRDYCRGGKGIIDLEQLRGKICIVGLTAVATHDLNPMPLQQRYPMVGLHANLINTILLKNFILRASPLVNILILIILSALVAAAVFKLKPLLEVLSAFCIVTGFIAVSFALFAFLNIWIDLFYPLILIAAVYISCTFYQYILEQNKRVLMQRDLNIAKRIQQSFLRQSPPESDIVDISFKMEPAKSIGGDLYDFVTNDDQSLGVMIGDVSGKGVPAALFMAMTVSNFRFHAKTEPDPVKVVTSLNNQIATESTSGLFVTLTYININAKHMKLSIVDAGHLPVVHARRSSKTVLIEAHSGMALGVMDGIEFSMREIPMAPGDVFVIYTDGVTEARNAAKEEFGEDRLKDSVSRYKSLTAKEITENIYSDILRFRKRAPQHDDITIMVIKVKG